jgi:hypothetical protein
MNQPALIIEVNSLKLPSAGSATGMISLAISGMKFPAGWNDFVVVLMSWWVQALLRLVRGESSHEIVPFMDGPYAVEVEMAPAGKLSLRALQGPDRNSEVASGERNAISFIQELIAQSVQLLEACRRQNWWSNDAEILESSLEALRKEVRGFPIERNL